MCLHLTTEKRRLSATPVPPPPQMGPETVYNRCTFSLANLARQASERCIRLNFFLRTPTTKQTWNLESYILDFVCFLIQYIFLSCSCFPCKNRSNVPSKLFNSISEKHKPHKLYAQCQHQRGQLESSLLTLLLLLSLPCRPSVQYVRTSSTSFLQDSTFA